jgi:hypothetical protein
MSETFSQEDVKHAIAVLISFAIVQGGSLDLNVWLSSERQFKLRVDQAPWTDPPQEQNIDPSRPFSLS